MQRLPLKQIEKGAKQCSCQGNGKSLTLIGKTSFVWCVIHHSNWRMSISCCWRALCNAPFQLVMPASLSVLVQYQTFWLVVKQMHMVSSLRVVALLGAISWLYEFELNRPSSAGPHLVPRTANKRTASSAGMHVYGSRYLVLSARFGLGTLHLLQGYTYMLHCAATPL